MDKLVSTQRERFWWPDAYQRDLFVKTEAAKLPGGSRVLDAGAGSCKYRPCFAHCRYETQDFCQYQGELVKYLQPIDHVCDIRHIPLPDKSFDAILCSEVFEHVPDPMAVLKEFARLLKPGGRLLLTTPFGTWLHMEPFHYYGGFTPYWFEHWLPRHGLQVQSIQSQGGPGRAAATNLGHFYASWARWERSLPRFRRWVSWGLRMCLKLPVHYGLPWLAAIMDPYLDSFRVSSGYLVVGVRREKDDPAQLPSLADWGRAAAP